MGKNNKINMKETWTEFYDLYTGGYKKTKYNEIYIQAPREKAIEVFINTFNRDPQECSCSCCGVDYSIYEHTAEELFKHRIDLGDGTYILDDEISKYSMFIYETDF